MKLNQRLREIRIEAGFSDKQLADRVGISRVAVYKTESGATNPRVKTLLLWLSVCGYEMVFFRSDDQLVTALSKLNDRERATVADLVRLLPDMPPANRDMYARIFASLADAAGS